MVSRRGERREGEVVYGKGESSEGESKELSERGERGE